MAAIYTYSEARQNLASLLDKAAEDGEVWIKRRNGQVFVIRPELSAQSPLDIAGVDLDLTAPEIVEFIHAGRKYGADDAATGKLPDHQ